jgi:hypothetical protein
MEVFLAPYTFAIANDHVWIRSLVGTTVPGPKLCSVVVKTQISPVSVVPRTPSENSVLHSTVEMESSLYGGLCGGTLAAAATE